MPDDSSSSRRSMSPTRFTKSMLVAPRAFVRKTLSPVDQMLHSAADLRFTYRNDETLESRLQALTKKLDRLSLLSSSEGDSDVVEDVAKPQYMAKSFAGILATASMYAGMDGLQQEEESVSEDQVDLLADSVSLHDASSQANRTMFEVSIEMDTDAISEMSTASKSKKDFIRDKLLHKVLEGSDEHFIEECPCWLLREIMVQGHLYLTTKHLFFFAFLPNFESDFCLTGSLQFVSGHGLSNSHRYWVILKGRHLTFHGSSTDLYFPLLSINLKDITSVQLATDEDKSSRFEIRRNDELIVLQADSFHAARHWVSGVKKQIFACKHSETNTMSVKIPLQNIADLEEDSILEKSGTLRVKALENTMTYAIDEYFFVFFKGGAKAMRQKLTKLLKDMQVNDSRITMDYTKDDGIVTPDNMLRAAAGDNKSPVSTSLEYYGYDDDRLTSTLTSEGDSTLEADTIQSNPTDSHINTKTVLKSPPYSDRMKKKLKSMAGNFRLVSPSRLPKLEDDIIIEQYSPGFLQDQNTDYYKSSKSIVSKLSFKRFQNVPLMWTADPVHFSYEGSYIFPVDDKYIADIETCTSSNKRFQHHFSLEEDVKLLASYHGYLNKNVPVYGKIYISDKYICFRSLLPGVSSKMILPLVDVENCYKESGFRFGYVGLVIVIQGHEELFLEFGNKTARDDCEVVILKVADSAALNQSPTKIQSHKEMSHRLSEAANLKLMEEKISEQGFDIPIMIEKNPYYTTVIKPSKNYKFGMLTIGSRGDVQPYIALAKGLLKEGHEVTILTHAEFEDWILSHGIGFKEIAGNPAELISLMVNHGSMNVGLLRDASTNFSGWINSLLESAWKGCQGLDILIESPSAMAGIHIAEALRIPYFRAFTMPWTRTRAYPHAFIVPDQKRGGSYNYFTHVLFETIFWKGISGKVNDWREKMLELPKTNLVQMQQNRVPFLYNVSPVVFPPSIDFNEWIKVTGYWFLDEKSNYNPSTEILTFLEEARRLGKKLVYIGFGSIVVNDPAKMTRTIVTAVEDAGVYCVLNKGWSDRFGDPDAKKVSEPLPKCIFNSGDIPHDWLFPRIDATVHHGGSGTTGASLRAGLPTIIKPFFGDQFFYASRIEDIGAGVSLKKLNRHSLSKALKDVTTNTRIIHKAKQVGEKIRSENGVAVAINAIYSELGYARSLIKHKNSSGDAKNDASENKPPIDAALTVEKQPGGEGSSSDSNSESWLLV